MAAKRPLGRAGEIRDERTQWGDGRTVWRLTPYMRERLCSGGSTEPTANSPALTRLYAGLGLETETKCDLRVASFS